MTVKNNFYLPIINALKSSTNLSNIQKELAISKQQLNYYIRRLKNSGIIIQKSKGYYEVVKDSKNSTVYDNFLSKDFIRGHAYVWTIKLPLAIEVLDKWKNRIEELKERGIHFNLVGALKNIPRIKVLGRKVWLCNNHLRIFDKKGNSYYGKTAIEVRKYVWNEVSLIVDALNNKLGLSINTLDINFNREHLAIIKNDLAIEYNKKGEQLHIKDKFGQWLLIDDSFAEGGELENIGKNSFKTNIPMQRWWNNNKETGFKVTPDFILDGFNKLIQNQQKDSQNISYIAQNYASHVKIVEKLNNLLDEPKVRKHIKNKLKGRQTTINEF